MLLLLCTSDADATAAAAYCHQFNDLLVFGSSAAPREELVRSVAHLTVSFQLSPDSAGAPRCPGRAAVVTVATAMAAATFTTPPVTNIIDTFIRKLKPFVL
ncbi:unnamed protein product [Gongylonema pulchrum]|uniref:Uncharacterized protein n=1 Tax=Gongylonema pulchrum TaxID=637853 RepID=A0A183E1J2_9BILA|nr:unnamed protein product [Gongylonema pulchrum]